jgi:6-phosphogluconolactonase (cycloisomerase 2 family)
VSPNTGQLRTVGPLAVTGLKDLKDAHFDISDVRNAALAALDDGQRMRLYEIDLATGKATLLGSVGQGQQRLVGMAIEP